MTENRQHCLHGGPEGGYVHSKEEGCPPDGKAYFDLLFNDVVKYNLATEEEARQARTTLGDEGFEAYYFMRGATPPMSHDKAIHAIRR